MDSASPPRPPGAQGSHLSPSQRPQHRACDHNGLLMPAGRAALVPLVFEPASYGYRGIEFLPLLLHLVSQPRRPTQSSNPIAMVTTNS